MTAIRLVSPGLVPGLLFAGLARPMTVCRGTPAIIDGMSSGYLWVKSFHIVFVAAWFAGLFYLPRLFVNLAMVAADSHAERERLLLMARKLYRFSGLLMIPAVVLGLVLWLGYRVGLGPGSGWMHVKLALVLLVLAYHFACRRMLGGFERSANRRGERWYRMFNESSVLLFAAIVVLVVVKPF
jgi:protoporphyrinogen IX oxidase